MSNKNTFSEVNPRPHFGELTGEINKFWKENKIFKKSIDIRSKDNPYFFYDGPPFVTGLPHYGHLLSGIAKDVVPRFWTMKGKRVERVWGWDCHGLPIENKVENKLGLKSRRDIEKVGLNKFIEECYSYVTEISNEWDYYIDYSGRWVDLKNAYKTMDQDYMESVWWVFKQIYKKDLIYKGKRVSLYCPRCGTPISNFEVAMDNSYKEITEPSNVYKYKLTDESLKNFKKVDSDVYLLAWSTTPWNKLATSALAVNPSIKYVLVKEGDEHYILAKSTLKMLKSEYKIIEEFEGKDLDGLHFEPHYDYYKLPKDKDAWVVLADNYVSAEEGTGIVTLAIYGEDDFRVLKERDVALIEHVDGEGHVTIDAKFKPKGSDIPWNGMYYLKANKFVNKDLTERGLMYHEEQLTHSVAECWRCRTRLMHAPQDAWFINIQKIKDQLLKSNEEIHWFPEHLKEGRFKKGIESAPDWCISRSRYWATPMPVWVCSNKECSHRVVIESRKELEKLSGKPVKDMHRPYIDEHSFACEKCGGVMNRVSDVLDSWMDAGSMPYAQHHYPFDNKEKVEKSFPADYIVEYVAQTRAWFYVLHVISNAMWDTHSFKNVICTGVIQGTDGRKMSKSYGNYPDPKRVLNTYGGDAFRLYMMSSPIMAAENLNINEDEIKEQNQRVLSILWNSYKYFVTYANMHGFSPDSSEKDLKLKNPLDKWILVQMKEFALETEKYIEDYNIPKATRLIRPFVQDLSTWYIRRSRDRFVAGDKQALQTLYIVLVETSKIIAPTLPFISEEIYQNLVVAKVLPESVHLCDWPEFSELEKSEKALQEDMQLTRDICSLGNEFRKREQLPTRQPLSKLSVNSDKLAIDASFLDIIKEELNVKNVEWKKSKGDLSVKFDTKLTQDLIDEGEARKIVRKIQAARKKAGVEMTDRVIVSLPEWPKKFEEEIKSKAMVKEIRKGDKVEVI